MKTKLAIVAAFAAAALIASAALSAGGDKNAVNNPNGSPADATFDSPYINGGDGRVLVYCDEGETLVLTPIGSTSAEATCVPLGD